MALNSNFRTLTADNIEGIVDDRNYLKSSFENGTITGWTEVAVALTSGLPTGTPTIGATAASSLALSATSVTPLSGSRSLLVDVPSALTAGHGFISDEFTLDRMDLGKVLTVSFDYERVSGTYNFSGTLGSQTWMVYIYDATLGAANWIQPAGFLGMNQSSGPGRVRATFQSSVTAGQKYRVAVIASQAASGASSIEFDNFTCSRQTAPIGPVVTDYTSFTGSWLASVTNPSIGNGTIRAWVARVGDSARIRYQIVPGSTTTFGAGDYYVMLPSGLTIDTNKSGPLTNGTQVFGSSYVLRAGVTRYFGVAAPYFTFNDRVSVKFQETVSGVNPARVSSNSAWSPTIPATLQNGDEIDIEFEVPISGWSSNVQLSNDTDTRVVSFGIGSASTQNIPNQATEGSEPIFTALSTPYIDTHGGWLGGGQYKIPVSGQYLINVKIPKLTSTTNNYAIIVKIFRNGVVLDNRFARYDTPAVNQAVVGIQSSQLATLNAGDVIDFRIFQNSGGTVTFGTEGTNISIQRLSGPSVVAASETVAMGARNSSGQSIPTGSSTTITNWTKAFDTHDSFNATTGLYTVPVSGKYLISGGVGYQTGALSIGNQCSVQIQRNGSDYQVIGGMFAHSTATSNMAANGSVEIQCVAGDILRLQTFQSMGGARLLLADLTWNYFTIVRVGN